MEGAGSRLGRASSRYVPSPTPPPPPTTSTTAKVFNGPVRKWKKKWVHVSSPNVKYQNTLSRSNGHGKPSRLFLCRWTPISPTTTAAADAEDVESLTEEQEPRRKFRYTPIVVLDKQKKEVDEKDNYEVKTIETYQSTALLTSKSDGMFEKPGIAKDSMRDSQASNQGLDATHNLHRGHFDLDLFFTDNSNDHNSLGQNEEAQFGRGSSGGFWALG